MWHGRLAHAAWHLLQTKGKKPTACAAGNSLLYGRANQRKRQAMACPTNLQTSGFLGDLSASSRLCGEFRRKDYRRPATSTPGSAMRATWRLLRYRSVIRRSSSIVSEPSGEWPTRQ